MLSLPDVNQTISKSAAQLEPGDKTMVPSNEIAQ